MVRNHTDRHSRQSGPRVLGFFGIALGAVALAGCLYERFSPGATDSQGVGQITGSQAAASARKLTTTISGAGPVTTIRVSGVYSDWQVFCRTAAGGYLFWIDADSGQPVAVLREPAADEGTGPPVNGDLRGGVSHREAMLWARRYLRRAGLPVPAGERPVRDHGFDFTFRVAAAMGAMRLLRVGVNPKDGSLEHLYNLLCRRSRPAAPDAAQITAVRWPGRERRGHWASLHWC